LNPSENYDIATDSVSSHRQPRGNDERYMKTQGMENDSYHEACGCVVVVRSMEQTPGGGVLVCLFDERWSSPEKERPQEVKVMFLGCDKKERRF
jgi:hypothetical protein